jgi:protein-S-isoprenylcysteine O-methyltransferase Ste14
MSRHAATLAVEAGWAVWALVWVAGALYNARHAPKVERRMGGGGAWAGGAVAVWVAVRLSHRLDGGALEVHAAWARWLGLAVLLCALAFTLWARAALGTMWSSVAAAKDHHELRVDGPYAVTRHPIYTGMLGMLLGSALLEGLGLWVPALVVAVGIVAVKVSREETLLRDVFPDAYERYRRRVPALLPGAKLLSRG